MPGKKTIRWNDETLQTILAARNALEKLGMHRPSIRSVLYYLLDLPGWSKDHYDTLCVRLGAWRDSGRIQFGLFADDGAGAHTRPLTSREIKERIAFLKDMIPAKLLKGGMMGLVFTEHIGLVDTISGFLDDEVPVVSSQGQLRREHLYSFIEGLIRVSKELGANGIKALALTDYDRAGVDIFETHKRWLKAIFDIDLRRWAVTEKQVRDLDLPTHQTHQLDGILGRDALRGGALKADLRRQFGL